MRLQTLKLAALLIPVTLVACAGHMTRDESWAKAQALPAAQPVPAG